jgi:hypothetical protein
MKTPFPILIEVGTLGIMENIIYKQIEDCREIERKRNCIVLSWMEYDKEATYLFPSDSVIMVLNEQDCITYAMYPYGELHLS